jgi:hypothetical protein
MTRRRPGGARGWARMGGGGARSRWQPGAAAMWTPPTGGTRRCRSSGARTPAPDTRARTALVSQTIRIAPNKGSGLREDSRGDDEGSRRGHAPCMSRVRGSRGGGGAGAPRRRSTPAGCWYWS